MPIQTVLLIDDDDDIRTIGSISLSSVAGWETLLAPCGADGVVLAQTRRPDVILLDVMMPGMDGVETLEALRAADATRGIPVIFLTAKVHGREVERYHGLGVAGVISKPFDPMKLPDDIRTIVGTG